MTHMAADRLKIGDHQIDAPLLAFARELLQASGGLRGGNQIAGQRLSVPHTVIDVREPQSINFGDVKIVLQIAQTAIEGSHLHSVAFFPQVQDNFPGASRMS